jgi:hypothetical protein
MTTLIEAGGSAADVNGPPAVTPEKANQFRRARLADQPDNAPVATNELRAATLARATQPAEGAAETARSAVAPGQGLSQLVNHRVEPRSQRPRPRRVVIPDLPGCDLRPDPLTAKTPPELVDVLRRYRIWAGEPSFREMAAAVQGVAASTLCSALGRDALPSFDVVIAVVIGCGGSDEDLQRFATAWRRIRLPGLPDVHEPPSSLAVQIRPGSRSSA